MLKTLSLSLILLATVCAQSYHWPIRASRSLSATFCEYRTGHLHAGIDIKTWGEMEVPCLAADKGYIEEVTLSYKGYGRGLFLRLEDGRLVVYGHLERFLPAIEKQLQALQLEQQRYAVHLRFSPDQYHVKAGQLIAYSGTSGTEHPHLHFEIRDTTGRPLNPQLFYSGIKDNQPPIIDEFLLQPATADSRINGSHFSQLISASSSPATIFVRGPFKVAVNTHDRANGTYNKYNIYRADLLVNDSLIFQRRFDVLPRSRHHAVDELYPGPLGKRKWHFMACYPPVPDSSESGLSAHPPGWIFPDGSSDLQVQVWDIYENTATAHLPFQEETAAGWQLTSVDDNLMITRTYDPQGYERFQFYTGKQRFIPVSQTLYHLSATTWILNQDLVSDGLQAVGAIHGQTIWLQPPPSQNMSEIEHHWLSFADSCVLQLTAEDAYIFPRTIQLFQGTQSRVVSLTQTDSQTAESSLLPLAWRARSDSISWMHAPGKTVVLPLAPYTMLLPHAERARSLPPPLTGSFKAINSGTDTLYFQLDTLSGVFDDQLLTGLRIRVLSSADTAFHGELQFQLPHTVTGYAVFTPGPKNSWLPLESRQLDRRLTATVRGGDYFLFRDDQGPVVQTIHPRKYVRRSSRLLFKLRDNSGSIVIPSGGFKALLDNQLFFPDYNPLRHELSFHVPAELTSGRHIFSLDVTDAAGNTTHFEHTFRLKR